MFGWLNKDVNGVFTRNPIPMIGYSDFSSEDETVGKKKKKNKIALKSEASKLQGYSYQLAQLDYSIFTKFKVEPAYVPSDPGVVSQWHIKNTATGIDINVEDVWNDYTGAGIKVAILDDGVEYTHEDLAENYDTSLDLDVSASSSNDYDAMAEAGDGHGTAVAGLIAAADNGLGGVGVAYGSTISGIRLDFSELEVQDLVDSFNHAAKFDVMNNSWSINRFYEDDLNGARLGAIGAAVQNAAENGRDGLGTSMVFSAGNSKLSGHNVNNHGHQNSRYTVTVGAIEDDGTSAYYSTPGASVLVSAPSNGGSQGIYTTDRTGGEGYSSDDYTSSFGGTSAAAPIVTGVIALMYEANPLLGYRDVQEILALSARQTDATHPEWAQNGARNWNGGGMHISHDVGFGLVDAFTAVRLAESWSLQNTAHNEESVIASGAATTLASGATTTVTVSVGSHLDIDHVEASMVMTGVSYFLSSLTISLTSPDGTTSVLAQNANTDLTRLDWDFTSVRHWGEDSYGDWTVSFMNSGSSSIDLSEMDLNFYGDSTNDDTYVYTEEFSVFATAERTLLGDTDDGNDTINASAVRSNCVIDLNAGATSSIDGQSILMSETSLIENAYSGDLNDQLMGNFLSNTLSGGRGDDLLTGGAGDDVLLGGMGTDTAYFGGMHSDYTVIDYGEGTYLVSGTDGADRLSDIEWLEFDDGTYTFSDLQRSEHNVAPEIELVQNHEISGWVSSNHSRRIAEGAATVTLGDGRIFVNHAKWGGTADLSILDADGTMLLSHMVLDEPSEAFPSDTAITELADGTLMATWKEHGSEKDGTNSNLKGQRVDASGNRLGGNVTFNNAGRSGDVATIGLNDGNIFVVSGRSCRVYDIYGNEMSDATYFAGTVLDIQIRQPIIKSTPDGGFVLVYYSSGDDHGLFAQHYGPDGQPIEEPVRIIGELESSSVYPDMDICPNGDIWVSYGGGFGEGPIYVSHFDRDTGVWKTIAPVHFQDSEEDVVSQIIGLDDGSFVLAWNEKMVQRFAADGTPLSEPYKLDDRFWDVPLSLEHIQGDEFAVLTNETMQKIIVPNGPAVPINITDVDGETLSSATISITNGFIAGADELAVTISEGSSIRASYDALTGQLGLSGIATIAEYHTVIQSLRLTSSEKGKRTLSVQVSDTSSTNAESNIVSFDRTLPVVPNLTAQTILLDAEEDDSVIGELLASNDFGSSLEFTLVEGPEIGTLQIDTIGTYTYNPEGGFEHLSEGESQSVSFTYKVSDGIETVLQTSEIRVAGSNDGSNITWTGVSRPLLKSVSESQVNTDTEGTQLNPDIAMLMDGTFVATWQGPDTSYIYRRHYDRNGQPLSDEMKMLQDESYGNVIEPRITALKDGGYTVSWIDNGKWVVLRKFNADHSRGATYLRVANSDASITDYDVIPNETNFYTHILVGDRWQEDTGAFVDAEATRLSNQAIAALSNIIVDGSYRLRIHLDEVHISDLEYTQSTKIASSLIPLETDGFVVSWASDEGGIFANIYDGDGILTTSNISISQTSISPGSDIKSALLSDGTFVVAWQDDTGFKAQLIDRDGTLVNDEIVINNEEVTGSELAITANDNRGFTAVWRENEEISIQFFEERDEYHTGDGEVVLFDALSIEDVDGTTVSSAQIVISSGFVAGDDHLDVALDPLGSVKASYDAATGVLSLVGEASLADYQSILQTVTYENSSATPSGDTRVFRLQTNDGSVENALSNEFLVTWKIVASESDKPAPLHEPMRQPTFTPAATEGGSIEGTEAGEILYGTANDDVMNGFGGDDALAGGDGNDTLSGGTGADLLYGGAGDDTFLFNRGDDADTILDKGEPGSNDRVLFGADIAYDQLWFVQNHEDLEVSVIGTNDSVTLKGWYAGENPGMVARFETEAGATLSMAKVDSLVSAMAAFDAPALGETDLSGALQDSLMTTLQGAWENEAV